MRVILAEKPSVARDIARCIGATIKHKGYIDGNGWAVTWAFGHLVELVEPDKYDPALKNWSLAPLPFIPNPFKLRVSRRKGVSEQFKIIQNLFKKADSIVCATDAGREGELIFRYIQEKTGVLGKPAQRLWINSLTDSAIKSGFGKLQPLSAYDNLAAAAKCRSEADWIIGLNSTRAYTVRFSHGQGVLSIGRVQTPVLAMIVKREREIRDFKPEPFWELKTKYRDVIFKHQHGKFKKPEEPQQILQQITNQPFTITDCKDKSISQPPPLLFDLTELQRTMNRMTGMPAGKTLLVAQSLYEKKYISYPRTDSKYLSDDIFPQCQSTLTKLGKKYSSEVNGVISPLKRSKRFFNNGKVSDHHAIIPTGVIPSNLDRDAAKVYDIITKRFIAIFYPNCDKSQTEVFGESVAEPFKATGTRVLSPGWTDLYSTKSKDDGQILPAFTLREKGHHLPVLTDGMTKPPSYYTEGTLLGAMESAGRQIDDEELKDAMKEKGLGTPATRAAIIETLVKRDYIYKKAKFLRTQSKGEKLIDLLAGQHTLTSPELTGDWEHKLKMIEKGQYDSNTFMNEVSSFAEALISQVKGNASPIGLGQCPLCGKSVITGKKGGYGCSGWREGCMFRFFGEQFGVKLTEDHVSQLLSRGHLSRIRKLKIDDETEIQGYITLDLKTGQLSVITKSEKEDRESVGSCPICTGSVLEQYKSYSCSSCDFVLWKTIAGKKVSPALAGVILSRKRTLKLPGFRSKRGKRFSATIVLKDGKTELEF